MASAKPEVDMSYFLQRFLKLNYGPMTRLRYSIICCFVGLAATLNARDEEFSEPRQPQLVQLNQGWSEREIQFYYHASEGTNLAPLEFFLNLPDPGKVGSRFVDKLSNFYGFVPAEKSVLNPLGLPVGLAVDERPSGNGDRIYIGITCSACHTRQLTYSRVDSSGHATSWIIPVYGGPSLIDMPRFKRDLYDAFFALLEKEELIKVFGQRLLGRAPDAGEIAALRDEIKEFTGPVAVTRSILLESKVPPADFGPGNLNALTQGYYNNLGLIGWLTKKGHLEPRTNALPGPRFEGADNYPPVWFATGDTWAQWFVEIHHPGPRNWVQSVSTSEVRPPKMVADLKAGVVLGSIHFDNIAEIQHSLELLRTPKWPERVFGSLDYKMVEDGRLLYEQHCASCHARHVLPPNSLGIVFRERPAFDVGTDSTAYLQFADGAAKRVEDLKGLSEKILKLRQIQLEKVFGQDVASNYMKLYSRGRPNDFAMAKDLYVDNPKANWQKSGASYWASPLEGIFASSPYFHNGSVRTLWEVLTPPKQRQEAFFTGSTEFDSAGIGIKSEGAFLYDTKEPGKGNAGHVFGTELTREKKAALIEYLKSL
jgi:hypothetical protein